jgi:hypothetical protein
MDRFMSHVDTNAPDGCWNWTGSVRDGYGQFCVERTKPVGAHRVSMLLFRGLAIRLGRAMNVDHLCRNRRCVNPDHLEYVTFTENIRRAFRDNGRGMGTHCRKGHEYTEANTHWYRDHRYCRACRRIQEQGRRDRGVSTWQRQQQEKKSLAAL